MDKTTNAFDFVTIAIAAYAAIVSTLLSAVAIYRDRYRLKIRVEWIGYPTPGITIKCVNTGRRPVGLERIMFVHETGWLSRWRLRGDKVRNGESYGFRGDDYPTPPSPITDLPVHLEIAKDATFHYSLDPRVAQAKGLVVFDSFGKVIVYRFKSIDRFGKRLVLKTQDGRIFSPTELRDLAESLANDDEMAGVRAWLIKVADHAAEKEVHVRLKGTPSREGMTVESFYAGSEESAPLFDAENRTATLGRGPFPTGVTVLFVASVIITALLAWHPWSR
ncbi:hypothetical protein G7072_04100 [Nocardioides sp. HDW12B]|uniref:hypothetical protein n=1 Tax=Nocardioides sp. HDW12B TaxID=2714939 RepID=UPI0014087632|nr:hypothetical protein [Nocardioides sp. HDW12B]QIK65627.1 hypothetical protein G7072_04100 [Nocardioides sp. HDW12B]